ncbi:S8 family peptidase [Kangiella sp. HZ709]|uniref:S8 family peptidase n=1 Tax=Kangiella sp. HZ709 TaxID=2666328 RepID=UPI0012B02126|nr:S8 family peptidase [Kangiella sp. HZ709]MRX28265.1 S8 family serine peptidase [Kangiella sp. HZ709]
MKLKKVVAGLAIALGVTGVHAGEYRVAQDSTKKIKNQYIVGFKEAPLQSMQLSGFNNASAVSFMAQDLGAKYRGNVKMTFKKALKGGVFKMSQKDAQTMANDPRIAFVEEDQMMSINATQNNATWGLDRIDQANLPLNSTYNYDTSASNVNAYIIDTGVLNSHSDFGGRSFSGIDTVDNDNNSTDCNGHGTHVAGTVAGSTYGVAKGAKIYGVRVLGCNGSGSNSGVIAGIDWVANNHVKPAVANMSLGGGASSATDNAVANLVNSGVTVVVAAGNDNSNACNYSPARAPSAITVGSTTSSDARSSFSNFGTCLDIYAPGSSITSAWSNGGVRTISGTSMASPHVAGVAALYLANNPNATPAQVTAAVTGNAISGKVSDAKSGSPNLLLQSLFGGTPPPPPPPGDAELTNGQAVTGLSGSTGNEQFFTLEVPAGATNLSFNINGGSGDADLYVRFGSKPTTATYDCRPYRNGNSETCDISNVQAGTYHVMLRAYSSYSGVNLTGSFDEGGTNPPPVDDTLSETGLSGGRNSQQFFTLEVPAGRSQVSISISGGSGDADLYVRYGSNPTTSSYDCRPYRNGNSETCTLNAQAGTYYVMLRGYRAYSGVSLSGSSN